MPRCTTLAAAAELLERAAAAPAGWTPLTLVLGTEAPLKPTLLVRGGVRLADHDAPGAATVGPAGPGAAGDGRGELGLGQGDHLQIPFTRHWWRA